MSNARLSRTSPKATKPINIKADTHKLSNMGCNPVSVRGVLGERRNRIAGIRTKRM